MCLWDLDTLAMERLRFPDPLEMITGRFLRRSPELYRWRIEDRLRKLQAGPDDLANHDDLTVAYDKVGQHDRAIETILAKDGKRPGLYETEANLGTFLIHAGRLEEALEHIGRALRINPDAHFGREKYQALLVEHVLERRKGGPSGGQTFGAFLGNRLGDGRLPEAERHAAIGGVLGMMKFSKHDSPLLLEALAGLLGEGAPSDDERRLAARAALNASYAAGDEARAAYREMARGALAGQGGRPVGTLEEVEGAFRQELAEAEAWYAEVRANELSWIREGKDPDREFGRRYYGRPSAFRRWLTGGTILNNLLALPGALLIAVVLLTCLLRCFAWLLSQFGIDAPCPP